MCAQADDVDGPMLASEAFETALDCATFIAMRFNHPYDGDALEELVRGRWKPIDPLPAIYYLLAAVMELDDLRSSVFGRYAKGGRRWRSDEEVVTR